MLRFLVRFGEAGLLLPSVFMIAEELLERWSKASPDNASLYRWYFIGHRLNDLASFLGGLVFPFGSLLSLYKYPSIFIFITVLALNTAWYVLIGTFIWLGRTRNKWYYCLAALPISMQLGLAIWGSNILRWKWQIL